MYKAEDYHIGWICALPLELAAAVSLLDEEHPEFEQGWHDSNNYHLGRIGKHNIVIACPRFGDHGQGPAAKVASNMQWAFPSIRFWLLVGVGGGVPSDDHDIRLGDVVVSSPGKRSGGVIQYDFGATLDTGRFEQRGSLNKPPAILLTALTRLYALHNRQDTTIQAILEKSVRQWPKRRENCTSPGPSKDILYQYDYHHVNQDSKDCSMCDESKTVHREPRHEPVAIHYGMIASGNQVMRDGKTRERHRKDHDILCFEMEASGLMDDFSCVVIRGICDYADSHKNKLWQDYAAATAAAYAKELLGVISPRRVARIDSTEMPAQAATQDRLLDKLEMRVRALENELTVLRGRIQPAPSGSSSQKTQHQSQRSDTKLSAIVGAEKGKMRQTDHENHDAGPSRSPPHSPDHVLSGQGARLDTGDPLLDTLPRIPVPERSPARDFSRGGSVSHDAPPPSPAMVSAASIQSPRLEAVSDLQDLMTRSPKATVTSSSSDPDTGSSSRLSESRTGNTSESTSESTKLKRDLQLSVDSFKLEAFYPANSPYIDLLARESVKHRQEFELAQQRSMRFTGTMNIFALHDVVIFLDDSGSMEFEEGGRRINQARTTIQHIVRSARLFSENGAQIFFMNSNVTSRTTRTDSDVARVFSAATFRGLTPIGTQFKAKVVEGVFLANIHAMLRPLLVFIITDGQPAGEKKEKLLEVMQEAKVSAERSRFGAGAITFQMIQVGNDSTATEFVRNLCTDLMLNPMYHAVHGSRTV